MQQVTMKSPPLKKRKTQTDMVIQMPWQSKRIFYPAGDYTEAALRARANYYQFGGNTGMVKK